MDNSQKLDEAFHVARWMDVLGGFIDRHKGLGIKLGNLETRLLADSLAEVRIDQPIYIAGLARSGTTLLLEILSWVPELTTHRYRDYPALYTPYLWNRFLDYTPQQKADPVERTHRGSPGDGDPQVLGTSLTGSGEGVSPSGEGTDGALGSTVGHELLRWPANVSYPDIVRHLAVSEGASFGRNHPKLTSRFGERRSLLA